VFVLSRAPFSKAAAIQDASSYIPDDHIMFIHDADLFPPCGLPDALRQTVVRGVQAVNLLLAYENEPTPGTYRGSWVKRTSSSIFCSTWRVGATN